MKYTEIRAAGQTANTVSADTLLAVCSAPDSAPRTDIITVGNFVASLNQVSANSIPLMSNTTPANSTIAISQGVMFYDANFLYVATANNTLRRIALASF